MTDGGFRRRRSSPVRERSLWSPRQRDNHRADACRERRHRRQAHTPEDPPPPSRRIGKNRLRFHDEECNDAGPVQPETNEK